MFPSHLLSSNGGLIFNENILTVFIDLDRLIETCPLSRKQRAVVNLLMQGWTIQDIADETGRDHQSVSRLFETAIDNLIKHHKTRWLGVVTGEIRGDGS